METVPTCNVGCINLGSKSDSSSSPTHVVMLGYVMYFVTYVAIFSFLIDETLSSTTFYCHGTVPKSTFVKFL